MSYGAVQRRVWHDERFRSWSRDMREVWLYLLSCPHGNRLGCFVAPVYYVADDVQIEPEAAERALQGLQEAGRIVFDPRARMVCIRNHLHPEFNPLANPNVVTAAIGDLAGLPDSRCCFEALLEAVERWGGEEKPFYGPLSQELESRLGRLRNNGSGNGSRNGLPNQDPDPNHDPDPELEPVISSPDGDSPKSEPISDLWTVWIEELGGRPPHPTLTQKRREKLRALYRERLRSDQDPIGLFRRVLDAVKGSDFHMGQRAYQFPESLFLNEERRDNWVQKALAVPSSAQVPVGPLSDIELQCYKERRAELESEGMDPEAAAERAMAEIRRAS